MPKKHLIKLCILALYGTLLFVVGIFHVIGQDEAQAWNIAQASNYPWGVLHHGEAEGHTPFWHLILWLLTFFSVDVVPFFTAALALVFAAALLRDEPFSLWVCALLLFGYFTLYDYPTIPRPYVLALFFSAIYASSLYRGNRNLVYLSVLLSLIAFSSAFGILLSSALGVLGLTMLWHEGWRPTLSRQLLTPLGIYFSTLTAAAYLIIFPLASNEFSQKVVTGGRLGEVRFTDALVSSAFPHWKALPMGIGNLLSQPSGQWFLVSSTVIVALSVLAILAKRKSGVLAWITACVIISVGAAYAGTGTTRHLGHLFIAAFCILWATSNSGRSGESIQFNRIWRAPVVVLMVVLLYHSSLGLYGAFSSVGKPQTAGKQIAEYLEETTNAPIKLITNNTHDIGHVMSYLDIAVFDSVCNCWQKRADMSRSRRWSPETLYDQWCRLHREEQVTHALITSKSPLPLDDRFELVRQFSKGQRDNAEGSFQHWTVTTKGRASCSG